MKQIDSSIKHWLYRIKPVPQQFEMACTVHSRVGGDCNIYNREICYISQYLREYSEFRHGFFYQGEAVSTK